MSALPALSRRERFFAAGSLCSIALLAWGYTVYEARRMNVTGVCECMRMKISGPELSSWSVATRALDELGCAHRTRPISTPVEFRLWAR